VFVGDVGRPDLLESAAGKKGAMEPAARQLQESLYNRLTPFADFLQILPGHGAGSAWGKALGAVPTTTLGYERRFNGALKLALNDPEVFIKDILAGQSEPPLYFATMKRVNRDGIAVTGALRPPPHLDADVFTREAANSGTRILDARSDSESFDAGHFPHAIHAPLKSSFFSTSAGSYLAASDSILLVLENGNDADFAARQLYRIGSIKSWVGLPLRRRRRMDCSRLVSNE